MIDDSAKPEDEEPTRPEDDEADLTAAAAGAARDASKIEKPARPKLVSVTDEELDADEEEFRRMRQDLPGVQGSSAAGMVTISVGKAPTKNAFFRTHPEFRAIIPVVDLEVGMEQHFFAVTDPMCVSLASIGITVSNHTLYLTTTSQGALRIVPVRCANADGDSKRVRPH
jgi:hypothetical protein